MVNSMFMCCFLWESGGKHHKAAAMTCMYPLLHMFLINAMSIPTWCWIMCVFGDSRVKLDYVCVCVVCVCLVIG